MGIPCVSTRDGDISPTSMTELIGSGERSSAAETPHSAPLKRFVYHWFRAETVTRALRVASVICPVLVVINQYDVLLSLDFSPRLFFKIGLTFLVPYSVSSFSSARAYMDAEARHR